ncbi:MAG: YtxH domain-containing protein [Ruminococcaceae bacterium]|nr:YtxH domain-containing protein [Oscillospiraceae bacterium]
MCHTGSYLCGMGLGLVAGAIVGAAMLSRPEARKTTVGKAMQRVGNAVDSAVESVSDMM